MDRSISSLFIDTENNHSDDLQLLRISPTNDIGESSHHDVDNRQSKPRVQLHIPIVIKANATELQRGIGATPGNETGKFIRLTKQEYTNEAPPVQYNTIQKVFSIALPDHRHALGMGGCFDASPQSPSCFP